MGPSKQKNYSKLFYFMTPMNAIDFKGDLIVAELGTTAGAASILRVGKNGTITLAGVSNNLYLPVGLASDNNNLWVSDAVTGMVWQIFEAGNMVPVASGFSSPEGLSLDKHGNLLVVEAGVNRLSRINLATGAIGIVKEGLENGDLGILGTPPTFTMNGVAVGKFGRIFTTGDRGNVIYTSKY
jgi:hypothetical protein